VPGLHWIGLLLVGVSLTQGPAMLAAICWWTARISRGSWSRDEDKKLLERACRSWGRKVLHVFDRGYASSLWLGALHAYAARFVLRWRHQYRLLSDGKLKAAWKIAQGKKAWGSRGLWDARRRQWISASVLAFPVRHPDHPDLPLWLVVARRKGSTPWYLLTSAPVETEADAWKVVLAYARRWQIEVMWQTCKSELGMQSPRLWDWESRLKLLGLATLAYAFLLHLLSTPFRLVRRWLLRYAAHRTGRRLRATRVPLVRLRLALSRLWLAYPPRLSRRGRPGVGVS
jgi:Transposase DDE domain